MAYSHTNSKGNTYYLQGRERKTKNGSTTTTSKSVNHHSFIRSLLNFF